MREIKHSRTLRQPATQQERRVRGCDTAAQKNIRSERSEMNKVELRNRRCAGRCAARDEGYDRRNYKTI